LPETIGKYGRDQYIEGKENEMVADGARHGVMNHLVKS